MAEILVGIVVLSKCAIFRAGFAGVTQKIPGVGLFAEADCLDEFALILRANHDTNVVVIDLDDFTLDHVRHLRSKYARLRVISVSSATDRQAILDSLSAGSHGFVARNCAVSELTEALESVMAGRIFVPNIVASIPNRLNAAGNGAQRAAGIFGDLTDRQRDVIALLVQGKSNKEIGRYLRISENTVKIHVSAAFRHLGVKNRVAAVAALQSRSAIDPDKDTALATIAQYGRRDSDRPMDLKLIA